MLCLTFPPVKWWYNLSPSSQSAFWCNVVPAVFLSEVVTEVLHLVLMQCRQGSGVLRAPLICSVQYWDCMVGLCFNSCPAKPIQCGSVKISQQFRIFSWCSHDLKTFPFGSSILGSLLEPFHTPFAFLPFDCSLPLCSSEAWTQPKERCESSRSQLHMAFPKEMGALCKLHPCPTAKKHPIF